MNKKEKACELKKHSFRLIQLLTVQFQLVIAKVSMHDVRVETNEVFESQKHFEPIFQTVQNSTKAKKHKFTFNTGYFYMLSQLA